LFACVDEGGGHTELTDVFEHDVVVGGIESAFEVCAHYVDVFVVYFCPTHQHDDGDEGVVDAAKGAEAVLLLAEDAVGFCVLRACVFD
jgi:hypothetical protein